MTTPSVATLVHESLGERVYKSLRALLPSQAYPPGSKLNVEQRCRYPGVSRTPVWNAMRRLETEGLVSTVARHRVFLLNYGVDRVRDLLHDLVLTAARNQVPRKLLETVYAQILVLRLRSLDLPARLASSVAEHRAIFGALAAGDAGRAEPLSRAHADHVLADTLEFTGRGEPSADSARVDADPGSAPCGRGTPIATAPSGRH